MLGNSVEWISKKKCSKGATKGEAWYTLSAPHRHTDTHCALCKIKTWLYSCVADVVLTKHSLSYVLTIFCVHSAWNAQYVFLRLCSAHTVN